ncbi:MAG: histidine kinase [Bacteroidetes bacterium]|nr:MAG: histidine kinase [Bacteroidota bacterium]
MKDKKELLKQIMTALAKGEQAEADKLIRVFMDYVPEITAEEVSEVAQKLDDEGVFSDANQHMAIEQNVFGIIEQKMPEQDLESFPEGHPIHTFLAENKEIKNLCERAKGLIEDPLSFDQLYTDWVLLSKQFLLLNIHYLRKENQLFPFLEKRGFSHPSTIMWSIHDAIREIAKSFAKTVEDKDKESAYNVLATLQQNAYEMTVKEERVLLPKSSKLLTQEDWVSIRKGEDEIGWCYIEEPVLWNPTWTHPSQAGDDITNAISEQAAPKAFNPENAMRSSVGGINLEVGSITPEQINLIFKFLPFDVTYVDEFDEVRYYNKGDDRVFPRSPGIIGRQVKYCHPPKSVHIVEKIVDAFKKGERSEASFWINFQGKFVHIQYFAVRDDAGNYKGVIEITQDATTVRSLEGEQRLLDWE